MNPKEEFIQAFTQAMHNFHIKTGMHITEIDIVSVKQTAITHPMVEHLLIEIEVTAK